MTVGSGIATGTHAPNWRARLGVWVESSRFQRVVMALVIVNAITLGLETVPEVMAVAGHWLPLVDRTLLAIFVGEITLKLLAQGGRFLRSGWNLFDVAVITIALVPAAGPLSVFRALRVLRILRLVSVVPRLRAVVEALTRSLPGMGAMTLLLGIFFYVFAVVATKLFGADFPHWFGSLWTSMFSLFQIMTLVAWADIARTVMERHPAAWLFFIAFILLATFTVLNLFIALIVKAMEDPAVGPPAPRESGSTAALAGSASPEELGALRAEIAALRRELAGVTAQLPRLSGGPAT
jgi:voltage-gated sodium channel